MSAGGQLGIVTSPHPLATEAGAKVLRAGGDAIEAAIAIGATIGVVYPHFCGLGGDSVWLVADREGRRAAFLGIGQAAKALPAFDGPIPTRGPLSMLTTACTVDSLAACDGMVGAGMGRPRPLPGSSRRRYRSRPRRLSGLEVASVLARLSPQRSCALAGLRAGLHARLARPRSEAFSGRTASRGRSRPSPPTVPRSFYDGALAKTLAAGLAAAGSPLTAADLAATRTREAAPLSLCLPRL